MLKPVYLKNFIYSVPWIYSKFSAVVGVEVRALCVGPPTTGARVLGKSTPRPSTSCAYKIRYLVSLPTINEESGSNKFIPTTDLILFLNLPSRYEKHKPNNSIQSSSPGFMLSNKATPAQLSNDGSLFSGVNAFLTNQNSNNNNPAKPKAYGAWILFDEQFKYVSSSSGSEQVGSDEVFTSHVKTGLPIDKNGYLYIYLSNETPNINVYFDNLQVSHIRGRCWRRRIIIRVG